MSNLAELLEKKVALEKYLRILAVQFLFRYHVFLLRYFAGTEKSAFQAKLAKIGQANLSKAVAAKRLSLTILCTTATTEPTQFTMLMAMMKGLQAAVTKLQQTQPDRQTLRSRDKLVRPPHFTY